MKGDSKSCENCGATFIKKRKDHRFCSSTCRTLNHRAVKGIPEPEFMSNYEKDDKPNNVGISGNVSVPNILPSSISFISPDAELAKYNNDIVYWQNVIYNAKRNVFPSSIALGGLGIALGQETDSKILYGVLGAILGKGIEENSLNKREQTILIANENIRKLKRKISEIRKVARDIKLLEKRGLLETSKKENKVSINKKYDKSLFAENYRTEKIKSLNFSGSEWQYLFGNPSENFYMVVSGLPGNGKTSMCVKFAKYFQKNHGKVLFITREQAGQNKGFQELLNIYDVKNVMIDRERKKLSLEQLKKRSKGYDLVVLDSISTMGFDSKEIEEFRSKYPKIALLGILQSTKDGNHKGSQEFIHDADIVLKVENFVAKQTKSRFAMGKAEINIIG